MSAGSQRMHPFSMLFTEPNAEESFLESRRAGLLRASRFSNLVFIFCTLVNCAYLVISFLDGEHLEPGLREVLIHRSVCSGSFLVTFITIVIFTCRPCCMITTRRLELFQCCLMFALMPAVANLDWYYVATMHNLPDALFLADDQQCYEYASDTRLMLCWISILTASHFFMNLRWVSLLPVEAAGIFTYVVCAALGSPEGIHNVPMNMALFVGITCLASMAKRHLEQHERLSMLQLVAERVRRFESDFRLEQARSEHGGSLDTSPNIRQDLVRDADMRSMVTDQTGQTGFTQIIFDVKSNCRTQLTEMMKLGEQEHWLIEASQIRFNPKELIGRGNYGVILAGDLLGMPVAVKLPLASASLSLPDLANELRFLRRVRHPHIVAFQGACILPEVEMIFLVEELVKGTSLQALLHGKLELTPKQKQGVLLGVCRALRYLHGLKPSVAHGDLKPSNVLVTQRDNVPKLIDFGLSRIRATKSRQLGGTPRYMAPEVLLKSAQMSQADKADIFSFGRVIFFVLTESNPLNGLSVQDVVTQAEQGMVPDLQWPPTPFLESAQLLTAQCLKAAPEERLAAVDVEKMLQTWVVSKNSKEVLAEDQDMDPATRLVNACAVAAGMYLTQKNQI